MAANSVPRSEYEKVKADLQWYKQANFASFEKIKELEREIAELNHALEYARARK